MPSKNHGIPKQRKMEKNTIVEILHHDIIGKDVRYKVKLFGQDAPAYIWRSRFPSWRRHIERGFVATHPELEEWLKNQREARNSRRELQEEDEEEHSRETFSAPSSDEDQLLEEDGQEEDQGRREWEEEDEEEHGREASSRASSHEDQEDGQEEDQGRSEWEEGDEEEQYRESSSAASSHEDQQEHQDPERLLNLLNAMETNEDYKQRHFNNLMRKFAEDFKQNVICVAMNFGIKMDRSLSPLEIMKLLNNDRQKIQNVRSPAEEMPQNSRRQMSIDEDDIRKNIGSQEPNSEEVQINDCAPTEDSDSAEAIQVDADSIPMEDRIPETDQDGDNQKKLKIAQTAHEKMQMAANAMDSVQNKLFEMQARQIALQQQELQIQKDLYAGSQELVKMQQEVASSRESFREALKTMEDLKEQLKKA